MSEALSQLNLVLGVAPKQGQAPGSSLGAIPTNPATPDFLEDNAASGQQGRDGHGAAQDSFADLLEQESAIETTAKAGEDYPGDESRLAKLGLFFTDESPEFLPLENSAPLEMTKIAGNDVPAPGEVLPLFETELVRSEIPTTAELTSIVAADASALNALAPGDESHELVSAPAPELDSNPAGSSPPGADDDIFSNLAFLPPDASDSEAKLANRRAEVPGLRAQTDTPDAAITSGLSALSDSEALQTRLQNRALLNQSSAHGQAFEGERGASSASVFNLDQTMLRRAAARDVEFDPQRFGQRAGVATELLDENRSLHFESQLSRASTIVEKDNMFGAMGQGRDHGVAASPSSAQPGVGVANAIRQEQLNGTTVMAESEGLERRMLDMRLGTTVGRSEWGEHLGRQLTVMIARSTDQASIQLDPPELGPMQIRLHVQQDQVSLQIAAHHAVVRDAVEQSINRLQQLFAEEGLELLDVNISDDQTQGERNNRGEEPGGDELRDENILPLDDGKLTPMRIADRSDGKIDYFV